jgi:hypothetical protein
MVKMVGSDTRGFLWCLQRCFNECIVQCGARVGALRAREMTGGSGPGGSVSVYETRSRSRRAGRVEYTTGIRD